MLYPIYHHISCFVVGCIDTISGDRLEIRLSVSQDEIYSPVDESYEISYDNNISQISLINSKGITKSNVSIRLPTSSAQPMPCSFFRCKTMSACARCTSK